MIFRSLMLKIELIQLEKLGTLLSKTMSGLVQMHHITGVTIGYGSVIGAGSIVTKDSINGSLQVILPKLLKIMVMMMKEIILLTDYKGYFGSKWQSNPYRSGYDQQLLTRYFKNMALMLNTKNYRILVLIKNIGVGKQFYILLLKIKLLVIKAISKILFMALLLRAPL